MPKALCLASLVVAALVLLLFLADLIMRFAGMLEVAPLRGASLPMDIAFVIFGGIVAFMAWRTYQEQV